MTKLSNANETVGTSSIRNSENASVAAVTKSIYGSGQLPTQIGNAGSTSTKYGGSDDDGDTSDDGGGAAGFGGYSGSVQPGNTINNNAASAGAYDDGMYCGPATARNLFWNVTRVGEINVQSCPPGSTGIAKWRCSSNLLPTKSQKIKLNHNQNADDTNDNRMDDESLFANNMERGYMWQPSSPDLTQCRSMWLNSLEVRVNQRDSALVSIANDLSQVNYLHAFTSTHRCPYEFALFIYVFCFFCFFSFFLVNVCAVQVTNSKTLYGGDMLVTTKIIQLLCEKMTYDIETFTDQRQRESIVLELLNSVVKTGSNLLDETQELSWMDLSFEDQMRVATSLLTGLEDNAFLLADTIAAERNVVQKVKNIRKQSPSLNHSIFMYSPMYSDEHSLLHTSSYHILVLSVRVLETRNIASNQIFPDRAIEQVTNSEDSIELPRGALLENSEGGLVRIVFVSFDRLESILRPLDLSIEPKSYDSINNDGTIGESPLFKMFRLIRTKPMQTLLLEN